MVTQLPWSLVESRCGVTSLVSVVTVLPSLRQSLEVGDKINQSRDQSMFSGNNNYQCCRKCEVRLLESIIGTDKEKYTTAYLGLL